MLYCWVCHFFVWPAIFTRPRWQHLAACRSWLHSAFAAKCIRWWRPCRNRSWWSSLRSHWMLQDSQGMWIYDDDPDYLWLPMTIYDLWSYMIILWLYTYIYIYIYMYYILYIDCLSWSLMIYRILWSEAFLFQLRCCNAGASALHLAVLGGHLAFAQEIYVLGGLEFSRAEARCVPHRATNTMLGLKSCFSWLLPPKMSFGRMLPCHFVPFPRLAASYGNDRHCVWNWLGYRETRHERERERDRERETEAMQQMFWTLLACSFRPLMAWVATKHYEALGHHLSDRSSSIRIARWMFKMTMDESPYMWRPLKGIQT